MFLTPEFLFQRPGDVQLANGDKYNPPLDISGYKYIPEDLLSVKNCLVITLPDGSKVKGQWLHRMVVFTFGDKNGRRLSNYGFRTIIDHLDMNHCNNNVSNLELVSYGINLFRAYYRGDKNTSGDCAKRFKEYYNSLDAVDKKILDVEIALDIEGKY